METISGPFRIGWTRFRAPTMASATMVARMSSTTRPNMPTGRVVDGQRAPVTSRRRSRTRRPIRLASPTRAARARGRSDA